MWEYERAESVDPQRIILMGKIVRLEFIGSPVLFTLLCLSIIGIPAAILYIRAATAIVEEEVEDPTSFLEQYREGKYDREQ